MRRTLLWFLVCCICIGLLPAHYVWATTNEENLIYDFEKIKIQTITLQEKVSLESLYECMPTYVTAYTNGGHTVKKIAVTWKSEYDYEATNNHVYIFWAQWNREEYPIEDTEDIIPIIPFIEVVIESVPAPTTLSTGVQNIVDRAHQYANVMWTPVKDVYGWKKEFVFKRGVTYYGIPYSQPLEGCYIPYSASLDTFINAVNNENSLLYTRDGGYGSIHAPYYGSDCSAFVSFTYGLPRMTTSSIAKSSYFSRVSGNSVYQAKVGDCFNRSGLHVELITAIHYNADGTIGTFEVTEQTLYKTRIVAFTPTQLQTLINKRGYTLLRYHNRDAVTAPSGYVQLPEQPVITNVTEPIPLEEGESFDITGKISCVKWMSEVTVGCYDENGMMVLGANVTPNTTYYDIASLKEQISVETLGGGNYTYKITATTYDGTFVLYEQPFVVYPKDPDMPFQDVKRGTWYYETVKQIAKTGFMTGTHEVTFAPEDPMTRAMVVSVLHRMAGKPKTTYEELFADVEVGQWYTTPVIWAATNKIVSGYDNGGFGPMDNITREQVAVIIRNYVKSLGIDTTASVDLSKFKDTDDISSWAKSAITWAVDNGIMSGTTDGYINPKNNATRAECAKMLLKAYELIKENKPK